MKDSTCDSWIARAAPEWQALGSLIQKKMKSSESTTKQNPAQNESTPVTVMVGVILGCSLGTIVMLFLYLSRGEFIGMMVGSGFIGLICFMPVVSLIIGGIPGGIVGGLIGLVVGSYFKGFFE